MPPVGLGRMEKVFGSGAEHGRCMFCGAILTSRPGASRVSALVNVKKRERSSASKIVAGGLWAALILVYLAALGNASAFAATQSSRDRRYEQSSASSKLSENRRKQLEKEAELAALKQSEAELEASLADLDARLNETRQRLAEATARHQALVVQVDAIARRMAATEQRIRSISFIAKSRIVEMYKRPDGGMVDALLLSESVGEAARKSGLVTRVTRADRERIEEFLSLNKDLGEDKAVLDELSAAAAQAKAAVEAEEFALEETQVRLAASKAEQERRIEELIAEVDALQKEEAKIQAMLSPTRGPSGSVPVAGKGRFGWPVSGPVTSGFGQRCGSSGCRMHQGIDISAPVGTPVGASAAGTVVGAGSQGAYGLTVVIDHGDGFATLYAHLSSISVSPGQRVGQGTIVGAVGTTGNATGPHLHFEIRYRGSPVDPMAYL